MGRRQIPRRRRQPHLKGTLPFSQKEDTRGSSVGPFENPPHIRCGGFSFCNRSALTHRHSPARAGLLLNVLVPATPAITMPRFARPIPGAVCAHVVTRGNGRATVLHSDADFLSFTDLMKSAQERVALEIFAWCLMPNHVHLVVRPKDNGDLARWMHWLLTSHVQRHRTRYKTTGRIWQGRYKAFPIQEDRHLLTVLRYVERNPVRATLVAHAAEWRWSSAAERAALDDRTSLLAPSPLPLPSPWLEWVDAPLTAAELASIRRCVKRDRPLGDESWTRDIAGRLDLLGTLRPRGRPRVKFPVPPISEGCTRRNVRSS